MIEGSQIDWCGHANDIACAMAEMDDFANSIQLVKTYVDNNPDTLLVVTADHSTGGLTLGANGQYKWQTDVIKGVKATAGKLTGLLLETNDMASIWNEYTNIDYNKENQIKLEQAKKLGEDALKSPSRILSVEQVLQAGQQVAIPLSMYRYLLTALEAASLSVHKTILR